MEAIVHIHRAFMHKPAQLTTKVWMFHEFLQACGLQFNKMLPNNTNACGCQTIQTAIVACHQIGALSSERTKHLVHGLSFSCFLGLFCLPPRSGHKGKHCNQTAEHVRDVILSMVLSMVRFWQSNHKQLARSCAA
jgi:hypothetical protein